MGSTSTEPAGLGSLFKETAVKQLYSFRLIAEISNVSSQMLMLQIKITTVFILVLT